MLARARLPVAVRVALRGLVAADDVTADDVIGLYSSALILEDHDVDLVATDLLFEDVAFILKDEDGDVDFLAICCCCADDVTGFSDDVDGCCGGAVEGLGDDKCDDIHGD